MRQPISKRIVKPQNCVIAFGIPTTEAAFENHLQLKRDFASMYQYWGRYNRNVANIFASVEQPFRELGVKVCREVTLKQFGHLFGGEFDAVILFAHWRADAVEFADGFADVPSIIAEIPVEFDGLLDLCVCHPNDLVIALVQERPNLLTKYLQTEQATPRLWLYFYVALFTYLRDENTSYLRGLEDVIRAFMKIMRS